MSLSDIILRIFQEHGSLSSKQILEIITQNQHRYDIKRVPTLRTIQRYISEFIRSGILTPLPPIGREQKYSLTGGEERVTPQTYLAKKFRSELEKIKDEYLYGNILRAYRAAKILALSLPEPYKQQVKPAIEKIEKELEGIEVKACPSYTVLNTRVVQEEYLAKVGIPELFEKINEVLYKMEENVLEK